VNAQELFLDVSSGRFLDGDSKIPANQPKFYSNEQKRIKVSLRKVKNNALSSVTPSADSRYRIRFGTETQKLADITDISVTPPILIQALAQVSTAPSTQATGIALLTNYTPVTAVIRADISQATAVTAIITAGISTITATVTTRTIRIPFAQSSEQLATYVNSADIRLTNPAFSQTGEVRYGNIVLSMSAVLNIPIPAQFTAIASGGSVTTITITNRGSGYPAGSFSLNFSGGGATAGTITATAIAIASGGIITSVNLIGSGSGYATPPIVTLFTPDKQVASIDITNQIGQIGANKQRFYWAYGTTSVSTPDVPVNFSAPNTTSTTAFISVPSAFIKFINRNIWELNFVSGGYGYLSTPAVTHDAALVSTSKVSVVVTTRAGENFLTFVEDFSGQTYIKNGGAAINIEGFVGMLGRLGVSNALYRPAMPAEKYFEGSDFSIEPLKIAETKNESFATIVDSYGDIKYISLNPTVNADGSTKYSVPFLLSGQPIRATRALGSRQISNLPYYIPVQEYDTSVYYADIVYLEIAPNDARAVTRPRISKYSSAPIRSDYSVIYGENENIIPTLFPSSAKSTFILYDVVQGGGLFEPSFEIIDYGENYRDGNSGGSIYRPVRLGSLETSLLTQTVGPTTVTIYPNPIVLQEQNSQRVGTYGYFINSFLSREATVGSRPGSIGVQYYVADGGFGYIDGGSAVAIQYGTVTGARVTTARVTNKPQAYSDGQYNCYVQPPSVGTAASIGLFVQGGVSRVVILDSGSGYTSAPVVTAPSPDKKTGFVERVTITNSPRGYDVNKTYVLQTELSPDSDGNCSLELVNNGAGFAVNIIEAGFGYTTSPIVTAPSPDLPQGIINSVQVSTRGQGYSDGTYDCIVQSAPDGGKTPKIVFNKDRINATFNVLEQGYGYTTAPIVSVVTPFGNVVDGITITCGGSFYENNTISFVIDDSTGSGTILNTPTICGGVVKNISILNRGYGYSDTPKINFSLPLAPALPAQDPSDIIGNLIITTASAGAILSTSTNRNILMEVFETDGTGEQVVAQATVSLAKRIFN
jgi:hypothetical protein